MSCRDNGYDERRLDGADVIMVTGKCHLCDQTQYLQESHVWPSFGYKRFAADQSKGGRFADLLKQRLSNEQYKRFWFCTACEQNLSATENYAARLCARTGEAPHASQVYDESLLRFVTSISWRTLKFYRDHSVGRPSAKCEAYSHWKRYLRGSRSGVNPYTQHVFIINDPANIWNKLMGGTVFEEQSLVLSQIGPLLMVGHLDPKSLSVDEQETWRNSKIRRSGGMLAPIDGWVFDRVNAAENNITRAFAGCLLGHQAATVERTVSGHWEGKRTSHK